MLRRRAVKASIALPILLTSCRRKLAENSFVVESAPDSVSRFGIFEIALRAEHPVEDPFIDVAVDAEFTAPDGARIAVPGFYYGGGRWMIRYRPYATGRWEYSWKVRVDPGSASQGGGHVNCAGGDHAKGRVRQNPSNPMRWVFENGDPYFPIGIQEGVAAGTRSLAIDGEGPEGPRRDVSIEEYFKIYSNAGFNLFRFSQRNSSYALFDDLDHYDEAASIFTDGLLEVVRRNRMRVIFGFFGYYDEWAAGSTRWAREARRIGRTLWGDHEAINQPNDLATFEKEKRFVRYSIARWGVYADFWELLNERSASDQWTSAMAAYVHSTDPDNKPVSTSWEKPGLPEIDIVAPHWYESEGEFDSDLRVRQVAGKWKRARKPVIVGEQGNSGMNWDPGSALRMRIRAWTALFEELALVFWNTSWSKAGMNGGRWEPGSSNIYLGPEERGFIRALSDFTGRLDRDVRIAKISVEGGSAARAYALKSARLTAAYLHHYGDHHTLLEGAKVILASPEIPGAVAEWIDPATGVVIGRHPMPQGTATLDVPGFKVDIALLIM
jgi:hypothetical protein